MFHLHLFSVSSSKFRSNLQTKQHTNPSGYLDIRFNFRKSFHRIGIFLLFIVIFYKILSTGCSKKDKLFCI